MTGKRKVSEWIGTSPDQNIPPRVRVRVFEEFNGVCQITGRKIRPGDAWEVDHIIALANGGEHRESNFQPVLASSDAHKAKTREDMAVKRKIERVRKKHLGINKSRSGFGSNRDGKFKKKLDGTVVLRD